MARQLVEAGEDVPLLVLLDTPLPKDDPLSTRERLSIHKQNLERGGTRYVLDWARSKLVTRRRRGVPHDSQTYEAANFRSRSIEEAFYRALARYETGPVSVEILLCRPRLEAAHVFGPGRAINRDRRRIYNDNGWSRFARHVEVIETPGDHDTMVLEPNARILAAYLRPALERAERTAKRTPVEHPPPADAQQRRAS
jgi:thioesterase domain-containing protein